MKVDFHVHTEYSHDSWNSVPDVLSTAETVGLDAVLIADHDTVDGADAALERASEYDVDVIPGVERTVPAGEYGVHLVCGAVRSLPAADDLRTVVRDVHEQGGFVVVPHPFRKGTGLLAHRDAGTVDEDATAHVLEEAAAIEAINWKDRTRDIRQSLLFVEEQGCPIVAGTDAHVLETIGTVYTDVRDPATITTEATIEALVSTDVTLTLETFPDHLSKYDPQSSQTRNRLLSLGARLCNVVPGSEPNRTGRRLLKRLKSLRLQQTGEEMTNRVRINRHADNSLRCTYVGAE